MAVFFPFPTPPEVTKGVLACPSAAELSQWTRWGAGVLTVIITVQPRDVPAPAVKEHGTGINRRPWIPAPVTWLQALQLV